MMSIRLFRLLTVLLLTLVACQSSAQVRPTVAQVWREDSALRVRLLVNPTETYFFRQIIPAELTGYEIDRETGERGRERFFQEQLVVKDAEGNPLPGEVLSTGVQYLPNWAAGGWLEGQLQLSATSPEVELIICELSYALPNGEAGPLTMIPPAQRAGGTTEAFLALAAGQEASEAVSWTEPVSVELDALPDASAFVPDGVSAGAPRFFMFIDDLEVVVVVLVPYLWAVDTGLAAFPTGAEPSESEVAEAASGVGGAVGERLEVNVEGIQVIPYETTAAGVVFDQDGLPGKAPAAPAPEKLMVGAVLRYSTKGRPSLVEARWPLYSETGAAFAVFDTFADDLVFKEILTPTNPVVEWNDWGGLEALAKEADAQFGKIAPTRVKRPLAAILRIPLLSLALALCGVLVGVAVFIHRHRASRRPGYALIWVVSFACLALLTLPFFLVEVESPFAETPELSEERATEIVDNLNRNIYRAFDYAEEAAVYDSLAQSVAGESLEALYLQIREGLRAAELGGQVARVRAVTPIEGSLLEVGEDGAFRFRGQWDVTGTVRHMRHVHKRSNRYEAVFSVRPVGGSWKISAVEPLSQRRLTGEAASG